MKHRIGIIIGVMALALGAIACGGGAPSDIGKNDPPAPTGGVYAPTLAPTSQPTVDVPTKKTAAAKPVSAEQQNAIRTATDYINGDQGFSRSGLIDQLKFEGYSAKVSTAAVDSLHIDFNAQAERTAKGYLNGQAFSRKGLIEQLQFEGYTKSQAIWGVTQAGL